MVPLLTTVIHWRQWRPIVDPLALMSSLAPMVLMALMATMVPTATMVPMVLLATMVSMMLIATMAPLSPLHCPHWWQWWSLMTMAIHWWSIGTNEIVDANGDNGTNGAYCDMGANDDIGANGSAMDRYCHQWITIVTYGNNGDNSKIPYFLDARFLEGLL